MKTKNSATLSHLTIPDLDRDLYEVPLLFNARRPQTLRPGHGLEELIAALKAHELWALHDYRSRAQARRQLFAASHSERRERALLAEFPLGCWARCLD